MGKHERDWVEAAEKAVADGLNGTPTNDYIQAVVDEIREHLTQLRPKDVLVKGEWSGGANYDDPGDVLAHFASGEVANIELKFSHGRGSGTNKNPGQGFFNKRISDTILPYREFEETHRQQRLEYLSSKVGHVFKNYSAYCRELRRIRNLADAGNAEHVEIIKHIAGITNPGQEAYAAYAAEKLKGFLPRVNAVAIELLGLDDSQKQIKQEIIYCVVKKFESPGQTVDFYDYSEMDREITDVVATGQSIKFLNKSGRDVFRFSVNWKNICQGGATPSFNVWVGRAFVN
jgi:hypothetical protein